jgi:hypothetical protein
MLVRDERSSEGTLDGVVHPYTSFEKTERPEPYVFPVGHHARRKSEGTDSTDDAAQFGVQGERGVGACFLGLFLRGNNDGGVED